MQAIMFFIEDSVIPNHTVRFSVLEWLLCCCFVKQVSTIIL